MPLVLARHIGESVTVLIPPCAEPREMLVSVQPDPMDKRRIRLAFTAPDEVKILRTELMTQPTDAGGSARDGR